MAHRKSELPVILEPTSLQKMLDSQDLIIVDLCKPEVYQQLHIPGAVSFDYASLVSGRKPAPGLLPDLAHLNAQVSALGIHPTSHVVTYDDEGNGRAARLMWTLHVLGFEQVSVLNGGIHAWVNEGHPVEQQARQPIGTGSFFAKTIETDTLAKKSDVLSSLDNPDCMLLDARTPEEYSGSKVLASRGGHIPGSHNLNWTDTIDQARNMRLKTDDQLFRLLGALGFSKDKRIITYCQTHHRSSHSYMMLRHLGYDRVSGYAGAWSEWGNDPDTPVSTGYDN